MPDAYPPFASDATRVTRRTFLGWLAILVPVASGTTTPLPWVVRREKLDDALLRALATAILPSELGPDGMRRAADGLQAWVAGYRAGAETNHGYGSARIGITGADPSPRWALQLRTLDVDSRRVHGAGFTALTDEQRRAIVREQLTTDRANAIPGSVAGAQHVALALLASFYASPEATDLCYEASIAPGTCRPLSRLPQQPTPIQRRRSAP
jgi:hypothetical protein